MEWTAPDADRSEPPNVADERQMLEGWLEFHRATLLTKCAGLTAQQLRTRAAEPSNLSLLGLIRHLADVERSWFQRRIGGRQIDFLYGDLESNPDGDLDDVDTADAEADLAAYHREVEAAREVVKGRSLEETFFHDYRQVDLSVRWVYLHMIEEYARHNGHADLLRERIDGVTGE
ncbi:MAG TPA: DinB family protein [Frankiaceae bacterium]|jgi:uncharacterized damage-inducible protein DinB|nr:DinB family protein [Frankiaceae bacterium]